MAKKREVPKRPESWGEFLALPLADRLALVRQEQKERKSRGGR